MINSVGRLNLRKKELTFCIHTIVVQDFAFISSDM